METLLIVAVVLNSLILLGIVIGVAIIAARIGRVMKAAESAIDEIRRDLPPMLNAARDALRSVESLATKSETELDMIDAVLRSVNRLISGIAVAEVAAKAITGSRMTAASVLAGVKEALRTFKRPANDTKEA